MIYNIELKIALEKNNIMNIINNNHIEPEKMEIVLGLANSIMPLLHPKAYILINNEDHSIKRNQLSVIISLGEYIDKLQEVYLQSGSIWYSYLINCISMEYLSEAYEQVNLFVNKKTGFWIEKYDFFGDGNPLSEIINIFKDINPKDIFCNEEYSLYPKQSVVFKGNLIKEKGLKCSICANCNNANCENRKYEDDICKTKENEIVQGEKDHITNEKKSDLNKSIYNKSTGNIKYTYGYQRIFYK